MKLGVNLRLMGPQSTRETILACAGAAEAAGLDSLWVPDHIAIPPDDAEGSGGRYLDALSALAFLAGTTGRISLGTAALVLPYRPALPTAKVIATVQELCGGRLRLGVGAGWMAAEFRAVGVPRAQRGRRTDETLAFLHACFSREVAESNGQPFLFLPRPARPPIYVGGAAPHALERTLRFGDGWMPIGAKTATLARDVSELRVRARAAERPEPEVIVLTALVADEPARVRDRVAELRDAGATELVHASRYPDADAFRREVDWIATHVS